MHTIKISATNSRYSNYVYRDQQFHWLYYCWTRRRRNFENWSSRQHQRKWCPFWRTSMPCNLWFMMAANQSTVKKSTLVAEWWALTTFWLESFRQPITVWLTERPHKHTVVNFQATFHVITSGHFRQRKKSTQKKRILLTVQLLKCMVMYFLCFH
jgi:hypothetical protein